ncbi:MAG: hypothetical protein HQ510_10020 [Candidatus Marinimicrobia bacterium]|nr:hypothetical protein [Candidatus Neomarinimicrobiota bacterium]
MQKYVVVVLALASFVFTQVDVSVGGIFQGGMTFQQVESDNQTTDFTLNRARFLISGTVNQNVKFFVQTEKGDMLDVKFIYDIPRFHSTACMGRFLPNYTYHMPIHTGKLGLINYPMLTSQTAPWRQVGIQSKTTIGETITINAGLFNGANEPNNWNDTVDDGKDLLLHGKYSIDKLTSGTYYWKVNAIGSKSGDMDGHRVGVYGKYDHHALQIVGEYLQGETDSDKFSGYYAQGASKFWEDQMRALIRFDAWDPNTNVDNDDSSTVTLGLNYYQDGLNSMFYFDYIINTTHPNANDNIFQIQYQILFSSK